MAIIKTNAKYNIIMKNKEYLMNNNKNFILAHNIVI